MAVVFVEVSFCRCAFEFWSWDVNGSLTTNRERELSQTRLPKSPPALHDPGSRGPVTVVRQFHQVGGEAIVRQLVLPVKRVWNDILLDCCGNLKSVKSRMLDIPWANMLRWCYDSTAVGLTRCQSWSGGEVTSTPWIWNQSDSITSFKPTHLFTLAHSP